MNESPGPAEQFVRLLGMKNVPLAIVLMALRAVLDLAPIAFAGRGAGVQKKRRQEAA